MSDSRRDAPAEQWTKLIKIHCHAKSVFLRAEEYDTSFKDFLQPVMELRHALDHVIRAEAVLLGITAPPDDDPDYVSHSFDKAIGHAYRAFFDAADWFSVSIRDRITRALESYSQECIAGVLPEYYSVLRPRVEETCKNIAAIRSAKDISKGKDLLEEVDQYRQALDDLLVACEKIEKAIPGMVDWTARARRGERSKWVGALAYSLVGTIVGGLIVYAVTSRREPQNPTTLAAPREEAFRAPAKMALPVPAATPVPDGSADLR